MKSAKHTGSAQAGNGRVHSSHPRTQEGPNFGREELKSEFEAMRKTIAIQRSEIATLKRELKALQSRVSIAETSTGKAEDKVLSIGPPSKRARSAPVEGPGAFDHIAFSDFRARLGITQAEMSLLLEASWLSIRRWESGKGQPRPAALLRIQSLMKLGKRAALARAKST